MLNVDKTVPSFQFFSLQAQGLGIRALKLGENEIELAKLPTWVNVVYNIFNSETGRLSPLVNQCRRLLDEVEKIPTIFSADESKLSEQKLCFAACVKTASAVADALSAAKSKEIKIKCNDLSYRVAGLQYRIEGVNGGLNRASIDQVLAEKLCATALQWKNDQPLIVKKEITAQEIKKLEEVSTYPEFAKVLLLSNKKMQNSFFSWTLRDNNKINKFIEFPAMAARLKSVYLASRAGKLASLCQLQKMEKENGISEKVITLAFSVENKTVYASMMDETQELHLDGGPITTISKVLKCFAQKNKEIGEFEAFLDGIRYWNSHNLGGIDLTKSDWWKQLPVVEEISREELERRCCGTLKDEQWVAFARASRTTADKDLNGRHGFFEIALPNGAGKYNIYPFGIFPKTFPQSILELVLFLGNTFRAKISYPDENIFYAHRQQASHPIPLTETEAREFIVMLQKELILSRHGHQIFQFGAENCAYWAQKTINTIQTKAHNFFQSDYVESHPLNPVLKVIFSFLRSLPTLVRNHFIMTVDTCLGSRRHITVFENGKKVRKSHHTSHVRNQFVIFNPAGLPEQILEGTLPGQVFLGNC